MDASQFGRVMAFSPFFTKDFFFFWEKINVLLQIPCFFKESHSKMMKVLIATIAYNMKGA
jgi:hypothetical protein